MASVDWKKVKTPSEVKAIMFHNSKETRTHTKTHDNTDIDKSKTAQNYSLDGLTYDERCKRYDERIAALDRTTNTNKRKDRVTLICLEYPVPKDLPPEQYADWYAATLQLITDRFGAENVVCSDFHVDEVHDYMDSISKQLVTSRAHIHVPVIPVDGDGKLNAKKIETKASMTALNNAIEDMTQQQFGVRFMTGEKRRGASVDKMKQQSAALVAQQAEANEQRSKELQQARTMLVNQASSQSAREKALKAREATLDAAEADYKAKAASGLRAIYDAEAAYRTASRQAMAAASPASAPDSEFMRFCRRKGYDKEFEREQAEKQAAEQERLRKQAAEAETKALLNRFQSGVRTLYDAPELPPEQQQEQSGYSFS